MRRHFPTISNGLVARRLSAPGSGRTSRRRALTCTCVALLLNLLACGPALALLSVGNSLGCKYAKIQDAIDAAAQTDIIDVEPNTYAEHLLITDKSLQIRACACADVVCVTKSHAVVDGSTTIKNLKPLLRIQTTGSNSITVDLTNIDFVNNDSVIDGGGIAWAAQGQLTLNNASVAGNTALNGGGIYFNGIGIGTGTAATLVFGNNVSISSNTATGSGGGLRIEGLSSFLMDGSNDRFSATPRTATEMASAMAAASPSSRRRRRMSARQSAQTPRSIRTPGTTAAASRSSEVASIRVRARTVP